MLLLNGTNIFLKFYKFLFIEIFVTSQADMFNGATSFNQPLNLLVYTSVTVAANITNFLLNSNISVANYSDLLIHWANTIPTADLIVGVVPSAHFQASDAAYVILTTTNSWTITDLGVTPDI